MRCNTGISPEILMDQHLIAEYRELLIPVGQLRKLEWVSKTPSPERFKLGTGHIVFWRKKQLYLKRRHEALVLEMDKRGFNHNFSFWDLEDIPDEFLNDWEPDLEASMLVRERVWERIQLKPEWYRFNKKTIEDIEGYKERLFNSSVTY